jgi:hypothetical protein
MSNWLWLISFEITCFKDTVMDLKIFSLNSFKIFGVKFRFYQPLYCSCVETNIRQQTVVPLPYYALIAADHTPN